MAGSISLSLSQQFDSTGAPLNGGLLYFYAAGTTTPQSAYQDSSLTLAWPNPITLDSAGRVPPFYLADGQIKIRLADSAGVTQVAADNLLVVGASSGSGSAPTVDATTILQTGDLKVRYGTGAHTGWVRANARTIGSGSSGGTERANADCQTLFEYLWGADANLTVSTGRGISANADWVANKTIALPDWRGRVIGGLDDMGNSAAGVLTSAGDGFGSANAEVPTTLGAKGGIQKQAISLAQLPIGITSTTGSAITVTANTANKNFPTTAGTVSDQPAPTTAGGHVPATSAGGGDWQNASSMATAGAVISTSNNTSGSNMPVLPPMRLATIYIKL